MGNFDLPEHFFSTLRTKVIPYIRGPSTLVHYLHVHQGNSQKVRLISSLSTSVRSAYQSDCLTRV